MNVEHRAKWKVDGTGGENVDEAKAIGWNEDHLGDLGHNDAEEGSGVNIGAPGYPDVGVEGNGTETRRAETSNLFRNHSTRP
jgi:hypothetical protein